MAQQTFRWKLFPFSLSGRAKQWYSLSVRSVEGSWEALREKIYLTFFPIPKVASLRCEILAFEQREKESLGAAWAHFTKLLASCLELGIQEPVLLQHFYLGLNFESTKFLDCSSRGSFAHLTPGEGRIALNKILENTPYTRIYDEFPNEAPDEPI